MRARHAAYFAGLVAQQMALLSETPRAGDTIRADFGNVRAAWDWVEHSMRADRAELPHQRSGVSARQVGGETIVVQAAS